MALWTRSAWVGTRLCRYSSSSTKVSVPCAPKDTATPPRERLVEVMRQRCEVFGTTFNPSGVRTGNKVLRQQLRGPALMDWYPRDSGLAIRDITRAFPQLQLRDLDEADRLARLDVARKRGKGPPKKKREKVVVNKKGGKKR